MVPCHKGDVQVDYGVACPLRSGAMAVMAATAASSEKATVNIFTNE